MAWPLNSVNRWFLCCAIGLACTACGGGGSSSASEPATPAPTSTTPTPAADPLDTELAVLIEAENLTGDASSNRTLPNITDPLAQLGKKLFFTKGLGGDLDSACVSCHHPMLGGADALSLPVGIGAADPDLLGPGRIHSADGLPNVPRNSPTVFNTGLWDTGLFFDSRVESFGKEEFANGAGSSIRTPDVGFGQVDPNAGANLAAAQAKFPVTSHEEMRGNSFESTGTNVDVRNHLAARLGNYGVGAGELTNNEWLAEFQAALGTGSASELITFDNIAAALSEYERSMVFTNNPFSEYVAGDLDALTDAQKRGAILFFTDADADGGGCVNCHSGDRFSDGDHHTVAFPQFGQGKGDGNADDFARERESGQTEDRYRYRTPSLLNVEVTAPYGHAGAYESLADVLNHYNNPNGSQDDFFANGACGLDQFADRTDCALLYPDAQANSDLALDKLRRERNANTTEFLDTDLTNNERADIVTFLRSLTDPCVQDRNCLAPWIAQTLEAADEQQLNARDGGGNLL